MVSNDDLYDALKIIQEECGRAQDCTKCRLRDPNDNTLCYLSADDSHIPFYWKLQESISTYVPFGG